MQIKTLFDPTKDIYRTIEKVITYSASQEARLRAEITEYIVTANIDEQFEKLLDRMQTAMESGGGNDVGVWVSGFYGSGKSSFTKYLGLALDDRVQLDGTRFLKYLQDRMTRPQTKALLAAVASRYPTAVVLLDLASEMVTGPTMDNVSTVLYYKVLQWAGYSQNLKVAALERRMKKDGRYTEFLARVQSDYNLNWDEVHNDPLVVDTVAPELAHAFYPQLFKTTTTFSTEAAEIVRFENERVKEMIDIVRETTGKQYILFIVDEVGQYIGSRPNLILNLDGLSKNLKQIGDGKVWIIGTAQQTLTEDDPQATLNSPELYKLKDRFPIQIELESSDIKEICHRRLLGKSTEGENAVGAWFDKHGQALRQHTKLQDARYYDADFDRTTFINLYPFLPAHFDILLHLLGALAKSTGGIGLRSAIKVVQDILIEGPQGHTPVAERELGWLATNVTLYDALEREIRANKPSIHKSVGKVLLRYPNSPVHEEVAKTVAVLQILGNMPVTPYNVASLMHSAIDAPPRREQVEAAIQELINDGFVPFGEKDGNLCFFSEKINDIEQKRGQVPLRSIETRRIFNEALQEAFTPLPRVQLAGSLTISAGLKALTAGNMVGLAGEREALQFAVEFAPPTEYEAARTRLVDESRQRTNERIVFLLGRTAPEADTMLADIYRCREIVNQNRSDPDQEVKDYCNAQTDRANKLTNDLKFLLLRVLGQGSFIFRGQATAVESLQGDVLEAARQQLAGVGEQVFDRYAEAPHRAETTLAEKFLRLPSLRAVTTATDPLGLVQMSGGSPRIRTEFKALVSLRDYLDRHGALDGKRLQDVFGDAPYGWSPDTLRYLVAAWLMAGEVKLKVSGREVTVNGQQAIEALKTNNSFKGVGVALRESRPSMDVLARAADRLGELIGDQVIPLEQDICKTAARHFPQFQLRYGPLAAKLETLGLPGAEIISSLTRDLADLLVTDASDAPQRLGAVDSTLYNYLQWAHNVDLALNNGLEKTIRSLQEHRREIEGLPDSGVPGKLRADLADDLRQLGDRLSQPLFYTRAADLASALTSIQNQVREATNQLIDAQVLGVHEAVQDLQRHFDWSELTQEEGAQVLAGLEALALTPTPDMTGMKRLLNQEYVIQQRVIAAKKHVETLGRERRAARLTEERERAVHQGRSRLARTLRVPSRLTNATQVRDLLQQLQDLQRDLATYSEIDVTITLGDE